MIGIRLSQIGGHKAGGGGVGAWGGGCYEPSSMQRRHVRQRERGRGVTDGIGTVCMEVSLSHAKNFRWSLGWRALSVLL